MGEVVSGLDAAWLTRVAALDPIAHAYAVWDRAHEVERVHFQSYREAGETRAYLVIWRGNPALPMVHWVGAEHGVDRLLDALPPRPLLAVVPPALVEGFRSRRGPLRLYDVEHRVLDDDAPLPPEPPGVRRLRSADNAALARLVAGGASQLLEGYRTVDLERTPVFGAFDGERLLGVAKASVTLPSVWILTGIVVDPARRGEGIGRAVTAAAVRAAVAAGARPTLHVRSDNTPALRVYDRLGFVTREHRAWIDAGGNRPP